MELRPNLIQQAGQAMSITPQVIQSIRLLTYGQEDLNAFLRDQEERNPLLDVQFAKPETPLHSDAGSKAENAAPGPSPIRSGGSTATFGTGGGPAELRSIEDTCAATLSLRDVLLRQIECAFDTPAEKLVAAEIVESIEPDGYLRRPLHAIADALGTSEARIEGVLSLIQEFEPVGVGARSLAECLRLQLCDRDHLSEAFELLLDNLDLVAKCELQRLARLCKVSDQDLAYMLRCLRSLDPRPGLKHDCCPALPAYPDLKLEMAADGDFQIELNSEMLPRVLVNREYYAELRGTARKPEDVRFVVDCMKDANWLTRNLDQRANTILRVATEIVRRQRDFFLHGVEHLKPLVQGEIAEAVGMHPSTICRATSNKHIMTNRGLLELKALFSKAISAPEGGGEVSSQSVRARIEALVNGETSKSILSDEAIAGQLRDEGVDIARRTVAKYREMMHIPSSQLRRRQKRAQAFEQSLCTA